MTDTPAGLVERLREAHSGEGTEYDRFDLIAEAADRIAELEKELAEAKQRHEDLERVARDYAKSANDECQRATDAETSRDNALIEAARLKAAYSKMNADVMRSLGKALGYPWYKDDQKNFPGATEADGICPGDMVAEAMADQAAARLDNALKVLREIGEICSRLYLSGNKREADYGDRLERIATLTESTKDTGQ